jgi:hypothetical protein
MTDTTNADERIEQLRERIDALEARVDELESSDGGPTDGLDHYDAEVIDRLDAGEEVTLAELRELYQTQGIRQSDTLKSRIRYLTGLEAFESAGMQRWTFAPEAER